jgi:hypothetical protein
VSVIWTDENGVTYNSADGLQPSTSYFQVLSVENNEKNEKGQDTKKLVVRFNCKVYNGVNVLSIDNAEATVCVAY